MTFTEWATLVLKGSFRFAKTMPHMPHYYSVRNTWEDQDAYTAVVQYIYDHGYTRTFGKTEYRYVNLNGCKYWCMGAPAHETTILNRADLKHDQHPYDLIADDYDERFNDVEYVDEDTRIFDMIGGMSDFNSMLDVGCGTGLALQYFAPTRYVGIDPSGGMLDQLRSSFKFPSHEYQLLQTGMESFHLNETFDAVISMYGCPSYMDRTAVQRMANYVGEGGVLFAMFYKNGYTPKTHQMVADLAPIVRHKKNVLKGDVIDLDDYFAIRYEDLG